MLGGKEVFIRDTKREELVRFCEMEQGDARSFIIPYSLERHEVEFAKQGITYKSIWFADRLIGFLILALDPDGRSVEFRRIVVSETGRGYGKRVVRMVEGICRDEFDRARVWLDVFETNARARHVYEQCGYRMFGRAEHKGRILLLYEKALEVSLHFHLAQANVARMRARLDHPIMDGFRSQIGRINAVADNSPGFVWRLQTYEGNATAIRVFDDERILFNMSIWESLEALRNYVYKSAHAVFYRNRGEWFEAMESAPLVLWWIPTGNRPSIEDAKARFDLLRLHGPTVEAFTFRQPFQAGGAA